MVRSAMVVNTVTEAKARLSELIARVQAGEEVIIGKAGKPAAVLRSYQTSSPQRRPGTMRGKIRIAPDFDDLPDDLAEAFGAR